MTTQFSVGDKVLLAATIKKIVVYDNAILYQVAECDQLVREEDIVAKVQKTWGIEKHESNYPFM